MTVKPQEVLQMVPDASKRQVILSAASATFGPQQCQGFSQLRMTILSSKAGTLTITQTPLQGTTTAIPTPAPIALVAGVAQEIIVGIVSDYITIVYTDPGGPGASTIDIAANLWPVSEEPDDLWQALAPNVWIKRGANGAYAPVAVPAPAAAPILISASNPNRLAATFRNWGNRVIFWGWDNTVTNATGFPMSPQEAFTVRDTSKSIYAITTAGVPATVDVRVVEEMKP